MREILKTTDPTVISFVTHILEEAEIMSFVFDTNVSILEGSIGIFPRRIMVVDEEYEEAKRILKYAGLDHELGKEKTRDRHSDRPGQFRVRTRHSR